MLALSPHQQTNTEHQESPHSCNAVSLCPQPGETSARIPSSVTSPFRSAHDVQRMREETDRSNTSRRHQTIDRIFTPKLQCCQVFLLRGRGESGQPFVRHSISQFCDCTRKKRGERAGCITAIPTQYLLHKKKEPTHTHHKMSMHDVSFAPQLAEASAWSPSSVTNSCPSLLVFQEEKSAQEVRTSSAAPCHPHSHEYRTNKDAHNTHRGSSQRVNSIFSVWPQPAF